MFEFGSNNGTDGMRSEREAAFAEPDWSGDCDYRGELRLSDLDELIARLSRTIEAGADQGWLNPYHARRSAFDLESVRCQLRHARAMRGAAAADALRSILSRADRLSRAIERAKVAG